MSEMCKKVFKMTNINVVDIKRKIISVTARPNAPRSDLNFTWNFSHKNKNQKKIVADCEASNIFKNLKYAMESSTTWEYHENNIMRISTLFCFYFDFDFFFCWSSIKSYVTIFYTNKYLALRWMCSEVIAFSILK